MNANSLIIAINPDALRRNLTAIAALFGLAHIGVIVAKFLGHDYLWGLGPQLNLSEELNPPSFYSTLLVLLSVAMSKLGYDVESAAGTGRSKYWLILVAGFLFMAYDEAFSVHEQLIVPTRELLGHHHLGLLYFAWVLPMGGLVLLLALWFWPFLKAMEPQLRRDCLIAAACYLGGAVGVEMLEGKQVEAQGRDIAYLTLVLFEELLEMLGMILYSTAVARYIGQTRGSVTLQFR